MGIEGVDTYFALLTNVEAELFVYHLSGLTLLGRGGEAWLGFAMGLWGCLLTSFRYLIYIEVASFDFINRVASRQYWKCSQLERNVCFPRSRSSVSH